MFQWLIVPGTHLGTDMWRAQRSTLCFGSSCRGHYCDWDPALLHGLGLGPGSQPLKPRHSPAGNSLPAFSSHLPPPREAKGVTSPLFQFVKPSLCKGRFFFSCRPLLWDSALCLPLFFGQSIFNWSVIRGHEIPSPVPAPSSSTYTP